MDNLDCRDISLWVCSVGIRIVCKGNFYFPNISLIYSHFLVPEAEEGFIIYDVTQESNGSWFTFSVFRDGEKVTGPVDYGECSRFLVKKIQDEGQHSLKSSRYLVFHGGCIEKSGTATILSASSQGGKSTLVAGSLIKGYRYMSDELAIIDCISKDVLSFPLALKLRDDVIDIFSDGNLESIVEESYLSEPDFDRRMNYVRIRSENVVAPSERIPIGQIVSVAYNPSVKSKIRKLEPLEASKRLLLCARTNDGLAFVLKTLSLLQSIRSFHLEGCEPLKMAEEIANL